MSASSIDPAIDALVAILAAAQLTGWDGAPVTVFDGPVAVASGDLTKVFVGIEDPLVGDDEIYTAATGQQQWGPIGRQGRDEEFSVFGAVTSWANDSDADLPWTQLRARARMVTDQIEVALRGDTTLRSAAMTWAGISITTVRYRRKPARTVARQFRVDGRARI